MRGGRRNAWGWDARHGKGAPKWLYLDGGFQMDATPEPDATKSLKV